MYWIVAPGLTRRFEQFWTIDLSFVLRGAEALKALRLNTPVKGDLRRK